MRVIFNNQFKKNSSDMYQLEVRSNRKKMWTAANDDYDKAVSYGNFIKSIV